MQGRHKLHGGPGMKKGDEEGSSGRVRQKLQMLNLQGLGTNGELRENLTSHLCHCHWLSLWE